MSITAYAPRPTGTRRIARSCAWRSESSSRSSESRPHAGATCTRVRGGLVPELRAIHPAAERNVARTASRLRDEADVLDAAVDAVLAGRSALEGAELAALPRALARLVLRRLAEDAAGRPAPDAAE